MPWDKIYEIPAIEFLSYLVYVRAKNTRARNELKKIKKQ
jgi:hypothetical protein